MDERYVVIRSLNTWRYSTAEATYAKSFLSRDSIYSEPLSLEEAEALAKLMNAAEEDIGGLRFKATERYLGNKW